VEEPGAKEAPQPLKGGQLLSAISTSIVRILRDHYGRGPMKAKTYVLDDIIVVVMRGSGFTPLEQTIMDSGEPDRVVEMRHEFQRVMAKRYSETIEQLTGRKVVAFPSHRLTSSPTSRWKSFRRRNTQRLRRARTGPTRINLPGRIPPGGCGLKSGPSELRRLVLRMGRIRAVPAFLGSSE
jgi:uncharacterized protein YbcI